MPTIATGSRPPPDGSDTVDGPGTAAASRTADGPGTADSSGTAVASGTADGSGTAATMAAPSSSTMKLVSRLIDGFSNSTLGSRSVLSDSLSRCTRETPVSESSP
ncbi:hypothetical protein SMICM17S_00624 [Streptomyces microflavus]